MHPPDRSLAAWRRRVLFVTLGVFGLLGSAAWPLPAAAVEPIDARDPGPSPRRTVEPPPRPAPDSTAAPTPTPTPIANRSPDAPGYDISWPQCNDGGYPEEFSFAVLGVNGGRVYSENPCLGEGEAASQLEWAGPDADFYANTGNPGPEHSSFWPSGQTAPRECDTEDSPGRDTSDCSYLYGWNAAADSYQRALDAFVSLGWADEDDERLPGDSTWWLDVETANSWRGDRRLNVATLQGAVDYLESMEVAEVGFYSTPLLWWRVTRGTDAFSEYPSWHAGARSESEARDRCDDRGFTGGELRMVQWIEDGLDLNYRCP